MSLTVFKETADYITSRERLFGFMEGFVAGSATARRVTFPVYLPVHYKNDMYVETVYGENQEDVMNDYMPICTDTDHSCHIHIYHLIENIESFVNEEDDDYPKTDLTREVVEEYLLRTKVLNKIKTELNSFAVFMMKRRVDAIRDMKEGKPCTVCDEIRRDAKEFNGVVMAIYDKYRSQPLVLIDEDDMTLKYT